MENKFCIVIPIYRDFLNCVEEIALKRLIEITKGKNYSIFFIMPNNLDISCYNEIIKDQIEIKEVKFDASYFKSTAAYSQLCINYDFYKSFSNYEYMYIYQLDCYLIKDDFELWCNKGYDYIGSPIISTDCGWNTVNKNAKTYEPYIGNGGFSLRKISTFMEICDPHGEFRTFYEITDEILKAVIFEDKYFCNDIYNMFYLKTPNWVEASNFSLDMSVDVIYNFFKLDAKPMALHAWDKNIRWWQTRLPELINNEEVINYCEKKHADFFKVYYDENNSTMR